MRVVTSVPLICVVLAVTGCAHQNQAAPIRTGFTGYSDPAADVARRSDDVLARLDESPGNPGLMEQFWSLFDLAYVEPGYAGSPGLTPESDTAFDGLLAQASQYAERGSSQSLEKVMDAERGPYGQTTEGAASLNEVLWRIFETQMQLTMDALARLSESRRSTIVEDVYLEPIHEGFDFDRIARAFDSVNVPSVLQDAAREIRRVAMDLSGYDSGRQ